MMNLSRSVALISLFLLPLLTFSFSVDNPTDRRVLVLLDDLSLKSSHSIFFSTLKSRGFDLDFKLAEDSKLALQRYGQYLYDGLIIFAPSTERKIFSPWSLVLCIYLGCDLDILLLFIGLVSQTNHFKRWQLMYKPPSPKKSCFCSLN